MNMSFFTKDTGDHLRLQDNLLKTAAECFATDVHISCRRVDPKDFWTHISTRSAQLGLLCYAKALEALCVSPENQQFGKTAVTHYHKFSLGNGGEIVSKGAE